MTFGALISVALSMVFIHVHDLYASCGRGLLLYIIQGVCVTDIYSFVHVVIYTMSGITDCIYKNVYIVNVLGRVHKYMYMHCTVVLQQHVQVHFV